MHEVKEGMREMRMARSKIWFVLYAIGGQVHQHTGGLLDIQVGHEFC
jgi:hypothetical protein